MVPAWNARTGRATAGVCGGTVVIGLCAKARSRSATRTSMVRPSFGRGASAEPITDNCPCPEVRNLQESLRSQRLRQMAAPLPVSRPDRTRPRPSEQLTALAAIRGR